MVVLAFFQGVALFYFAAKGIYAVSREYPGDNDRVLSILFALGLVILFTVTVSVL